LSFIKVLCIRQQTLNIESNFKKNIARGRNQRELLAREQFHNGKRALSGVTKMSQKDNILQINNKAL